MIDHKYNRILMDQIMRWHDKNRRCDWSITIRSYNYILIIHWNTLPWLWYIDDIFFLSTIDWLFLWEEIDWKRNRSMIEACMSTITGLKAAVSEAFIALDRVPAPCFATCHLAHPVSTQAAPLCGLTPLCDNACFYLRSTPSSPACERWHLSSLIKA